MYLAGTLCAEGWLERSDDTSGHSEDEEENEFSSDDKDLLEALDYVEVTDGTCQPYAWISYF